MISVILELKVEGLNPAISVLVGRERACVNFVHAHKPRLSVGSGHEVDACYRSGDGWLESRHAVFEKE